MKNKTLVIGNKNYSSWSLRPWLFLRKNNIQFDEQVIWLDQSEFLPEVSVHKAANKVPILIDDGLAIWDSLAIIDTAIDRYDCAYSWPGNAIKRAHARSIACEMHSGFPDLRAECPMDIRAKHEVSLSDAALKDIERVSTIWSQALNMPEDSSNENSLNERQDGWLYGEFSAADAMFAPVVFRLNTYGAKLSDEIQKYVNFVLADEALQAWISAAKSETPKMYLSA